MPPAEQPQAKPAASGDLDSVNGGGHDVFAAPPMERSGLHTRTLSFSELQRCARPSPRTAAAPGA